MAENLKKLLIVFLILIINGAEALPRRFYNDPGITGMNMSDSQFYHTIKISDHAPTQRKILSKGNYALNGEDVSNSRNDGKIIFPDEKDPVTPRYVVPVPKPSCDNPTFCEDVPNYPTEIVESLLRMNKELKIFSGVDLVPDVVHRVNAPPEDTSLCESYEKIVYPKVAQSKDKEWLFVLNHGDFAQGVRVETCGKENNDCSLIEGFNEGYKTMCKQKYIYRQLVAVSPGGQMKPDMFRFPASCCCHIKFTGNPLLRIGMNTSKKGDLPTSKVKKK